MEGEAVGSQDKSRSGTLSFPDPRPTVVMSSEGSGRVVGVRCTTCGYPMVESIQRCPVCRGVSEPAEFGPGGTVFAATVLRVPVPGRTPPYALAYVDLDDGPRILAHVDRTDASLHPNDRVHVAGTTQEGDPLVTPEVKP